MSEKGLLARAREEMKYEQMDPDIKAKWLAALRSGEYQQTQGRLRRNQPKSHAPAGFCCLGVLCDIGAKEGVLETRPELQNGNAYFGYRVAGDPFVSWSEMMPDPDIRAWAKLNPTDMDKLAEMNDTEGASFAEIADYIEEHL